MKTLINVILLIVNIISDAGVILFAIFGIYEQIMGPGEAERLLKKLHIPLSYNQTFLVGLSFVAIAGIVYFVRAKMSGKL